MSGEQDGRRVRGERKRAELIEATLRVVERDGVAGVSHRAVAREAGVSASSAIYYFETLDDLLVAALSAAADDYARQLREIIAGGGDDIDGLARMITEAAGPGRARALAERELTLLAVRRPALRAVATHWRDLVAEVARGHTADPLSVETAVAAADGLCAMVLLDREPPTTEQVSSLLRRALRPS